MFILIHSEMMNTLAYNFYEMSKVRGEAVYENFFPVDLNNETNSIIKIYNKPNLQP